MRCVIKSNLATLLVGPTGKLRVILFKTVYVIGVAGLTLPVRQGRQIELRSMMFAVARCAGQFAVATGGVG